MIENMDVGNLKQILYALNSLVKYSL